MVKIFAKFCPLEIWPPLPARLHEMTCILWHLAPYEHFMLALLKVCHNHHFCQICSFQFPWTWGGLENHASGIGEQGSGQTVSPKLH